jgi:hypothetical protein
VDKGVIAKYLARSFMLPLVMGVCFVYLVTSGALKSERELVAAGLLLLSFAGVFNASEAFKTWVWDRNGRAADERRGGGSGD